MCSSKGLLRIESNELLIAIQQYPQDTTAIVVSFFCKVVMWQLCCKISMCDVLYDVVDSIEPMCCMTASRYIALHNAVVDTYHLALVC